MVVRHLSATAVLCLSLMATAGAQDTSLPGDYVWAPACKTCHAAQYDAWEKTKHARALARLSGGDRRPGECLGCHVTGAPELADNNVNGNVQCEACHGAGRAHVAAAAGGAAKPGAITAKPAESTCVRCHSTKSPHFKFFAYGAMAPLVHQVPK